VVQAQGFLFSPALKAKSFLQLARALNADRSTPPPATRLDLSADDLQSAA